MEFHRKINMNNKPEIITKRKITPKVRIFTGNFQPNYYSIKQNNYPNHVLTYNNNKYICCPFYNRIFLSQSII